MATDPCLTIRDLVQRIPSMSTTTDEAGAEMVKTLLKSYCSNENDWEIYTRFDHKSYTRTLVHSGDNYNLMLLCWSEGQGSPIHDHPGSNCFVKILSGHLKETIFTMPTDVGSGDIAVMKELEVTTHARDDVTYIKDSMGLHRMENPSHTESCVTLHLYTPPFTECHTFDDRTGAQNTVVMTFEDKTGLLGGVHCSGDVNPGGTCRE